MLEDRVDIRKLASQWIVFHNHRLKVRRPFARGRPLPCPGLIVTISVSGQRTDPRVAHRPIRFCTGDASTGSQDSVSDRQFVRGRPNVHPLIMENQVVYMDKITSHPHAGCRIEKMAALDEALADRIPPDLLVKPRKVIFSSPDRRK